MNKSVTINSSSTVQDISTQIEIFLRDVWRYRWTSVIAAWLLALAGWAGVFVIPDKYQATAKVYVDTDSILRPLLKGLAVESNLRNKLQLMTRTLLSRPNLEKVLRATDMDVEASTEREKEILLTELRKRFDIASTRRHNLYTLSYEHKDPKRAKAVVQEILTILIETTLGDSRQDSDVAKKFLGQQIKEYESRLIEAERRLMEFKRKNIGMMPGQGQDYYGKLQDIQDRLEQGNFILTQLQKRREELKRQINEMIEAVSKSGSRAIKTSLDERIQNLRTRLDALLLKYTREHPDAQQIEETIQLLEKQKQDELKSLADGKGSSEVLETSPVYQEIKLALGKASADVASAQVTVKEYQKRLTEMERKVDVLPKIEAELASLNRDYMINKEQHLQLMARRESAKMSVDAETAGDQVKFQIIEPPHVSTVPSSPKRPILNTVVLIFSIAGAFGLVFLFSQFHPVVYHQKDLRDITGYPVFGTVSMVKDAKMQKKRKFDFMIYAASLGLLCTLYAVILFLQRLN